MRTSFLRTVTLVLSSAFLILMVVLLTWFKLAQPRILVLHSYDKGYEWTRDIDTGLKRVLDPKLRYRVLSHYMDEKNHTDKDFRRRAELLARRAIDSVNPTLIIAVDDDAQLVAKAFKDKPGVSIVFAGVNGGIEPYGYDKARNVTGIFERKPLLHIREALVAMRNSSGKPLGTRLISLGDTSSSVLTDDEKLRAFDWSPLTLVDSNNVRTFEQWKAAVIDAGKRADVLLISNYRALQRVDGRPESVPAEEVAHWTEQNSVIPAVGVAGFFTEDGGMFAVGVSGFEQGETAARMAIRILDDEVSPQDLPPVMPRQFLVYMNKSLMANRGLNLPPLYESFARATNNYME